MKKVVLLLAFILSVTLGFSQASSKINNSQNVEIIDSIPTHLVSCEPLPMGTWRKLKTSAIFAYQFNQIGVTTTSVGNWNTSYSWGDWSTQGFITSSALSPYKTISSYNSDTVGHATRTYVGDLFIPYRTKAQNDLLYQAIGSYLVSESDPYWHSDSGNYYTKLRANDLFQLNLGYTPYNSTNPAGYISSVPAQSFSSLTGKPTSLSGYGITDAYPLSGNPSGFITSVPAQSWSSITGKPSFATVATSGDYGDLINKPSIPTMFSDSVTFYNASGKINQKIKVWTGNVAPSTANGYSIDISSAGFSTIISANVIAVRNTSAAASSPNVSVKSKSTTALVVNIVEDNTATVSILGIGVLSGLPSVFANITGLTLDVVVFGY